MTNDIARRGVRVLIDRYLEVSNHYAREIRNHQKEYDNSPRRLNALIGRLEAIESSTVDPPPGLGACQEEQAQGQNIVPTPDTLAALRVSADEVLSRLNSPLELVPRNLWWLRKWLARDVLEIAAGLPSFTYAWDKLIDLNRLTLVPDPVFLRVRDNVLVATIEFERFVLELRRLVALACDTVPAASMTPEEALRSLCEPDHERLDPFFQTRVARVSNLLRRKDSLEQSLTVTDAHNDADTLALVGLELGFIQWLRMESLSKEHRKTIIMSLLVCSKLFLVEGLWRNAIEISTFAVALTGKMNQDLDLDPNEGTAMLRFNQLWARYKLGDDIAEELEQWDLNGQHARYSFLKCVLLRKFDDAVRILETLLPRGNSRELGNFSIAEADEWPILEDFRSSKHYEELKQRVAKQGGRGSNAQ